jgi:hypothetical protein
MIILHTTSDLKRKGKRMRTTVLTILTLFQFVSHDSVFSQEMIEPKKITNHL